MLSLKRLEPLGECPGLGVCTSRENGIPDRTLQVPPQRGPVCSIPQPYDAGDGFVSRHTHVGPYQDGMVV